MSKPENPQAFPDSTHSVFRESGMTLLDYFAGQEMARLEPFFDGGGDYDYEATAKYNYDYAEAMLAERQRRMNGESPTEH